MKKILLVLLFTLGIPFVGAQSVLLQPGVCVNFTSNQTINGMNYTSACAVNLTNATNISSFCQSIGFNSSNVVVTCNYGGPNITDISLLALTYMNNSVYYERNITNCMNQLNFSIQTFNSTNSQLSACNTDKATLAGQLQTANNNLGTANKDKDTAQSQIQTYGIGGLAIGAIGTYLFLKKKSESPEGPEDIPDISETGVD